MRGRFAAGLALLFGSSCASPTVPFAPGRDAPGESASAASLVAVSSAPGVAHEATTDDPELNAVLKKVSRARHLPITKPVKSKSLTRTALLAKLREKMDAELPPGIIALSGESLRALELVPVDYDFEAGLMKLLQGRIAGLYDPDDGTMYLLDDLGDDLKEETLNHELVHALQDQAFDLKPLLKYKPGRGDRSSAVQSLVEGDATNAMFEVDGGSSLYIEQGVIRAMFSLSTRFSLVGLETPTILQESLVSPYTDGFGFVQALRRRGGWSAVDDAFHHLPETTEQVLHVEKFVAHEPAIAIADPTLVALGPGFEAAYVDSLGELGLRQMLNEWLPRDIAVETASGWGGDRYVVARRQPEKGRSEIAVAFHVRMDTKKIADQLALRLDGAIGKRTKAAGGAGKFCKERADLGPIAWAQSGADVAIVAGPYVEHDGKIESLSTCAKLDPFLVETLGAPAASSPAPNSR